MSDLPVYTWADVTAKNSRETCWMVIDGKVIDVTKFLEEHPGGEEVLLEQAGQDATEAFEEIGHSDDARDLTAKMVIGFLKDASKAPKAKVSNSYTPPKATGTSISGVLLGLVPVVAAGAYLVYRYLENH